MFLNISPIPRLPSSKLHPQRQLGEVLNFNKQVGDALKEWCKKLKIKKKDLSWKRKGDSESKIKPWLSASSTNSELEPDSVCRHNSTWMNRLWKTLFSYKQEWGLIIVH